MSEVVGLPRPASTPIANDRDQATAPPPTDPNAAATIKSVAPGPPSVDPVADQTMPDAADDGDAEADSEAETLIQSPEKQRTRPDSVSVTGSVNIARLKDDDSNSAAAATDSDNKSRKRKRPSDEGRDEAPSVPSSRRSSPLSSPRIPLLSPDSDSDVSSHVVPRRTKADRPKRDANKPEEGTDSAEEKSTKPRKRRPSDILPTAGKSRSRNDSGVDPGSTERRETRSATYPRHSSDERSPSPRPISRREHKRGVSTQLILGEFERKKRGRPPLINTRRNHSADRAGSPSSEEDSDSPRRTRPGLHKFSSHDQDTMSPAKATGPRKWRDKNGRTFLSRACNNNDLEAAKARYKERPEDLNLADNAGNTPLQIAALEGFTDIVRFLLQQGCEVNTRNIDLETPLIDAVENCHVDVVRLLLEHGANPRLGNAKGDEPLELVPSDESAENTDEIKRMLREAKENPKRSWKGRKSTDTVELAREGTSSRAASAASPRDSPPAGPRSPPAIASRRRTGRSESTRNDLLWQATTQEQLTRSAAKGDVQGVANILNILQKAEPEALIAAAKAGHEEVLQYLLGMGDPDPDPEPVERGKPGYDTPMLAAIGRGHPEVVKLLLDQSGFNPTRIYRGRTYFEIAADRKGDQWKAEHDMLKAAYDKWPGRKLRKTASPRATRDSDKSKSGARRRSQSPISNKLRHSSSPMLTQKELPNKSPRREKEKNQGPLDTGDKRKPFRKEGIDSTAVSSDADQTVAAPRKGHAKRRSQSDLPAPSSIDSEGTHRRRRLMTGKDYRSQKNTVPEESSDNESVAVKTEPKSGSALKRARASLSPDGAASESGEASRIAAKKRRTVIESSPEETRPGPKRQNNMFSSPTLRERRLERSNPSENDQGSKRSKQPHLTQIKAEELPADLMEVDKQGARAPSVDMPAEEPSSVDGGPESRSEANTKATAQTSPTEAELELKKQEEARKAEEERIEQERIAKEKAAEEQRAAEERERLRKAEELERLRKAEEEAAAKKKEEEAAAARKREEEEAAARKRAEEEAARKREEEAAAARKKEEEERQERIKRELEERKRRQEEAVRQQRLEIERRRREALPILLGHTAMMLDNNDPTARSEEWLRKFLPLFTVKTQQLDSGVQPAQDNELWMPNYQVAGLLATKDLNLRSYTSFDRRPVTPWEKICLWKVSRNMLSYEYTTTGLNTPIAVARQREEEQRPKFYAMDELFWVKVSDFEDQAVRHSHLNGLKMRKQPISLRRIGSHSSESSAEHSPPPDGFSPKLVNGITHHVSPTALYSNGITR